MKLRTRVKVYKEKNDFDKLSMNLIKYLNDFLSPLDRIKMLALNKRLNNNLKREEVYQIYKKYKRSYSRLCKNETHCEIRCKNKHHDPLCFKNQDLEIINIHSSTINKINRNCTNCNITCCLRCSKKLMKKCSNQLCHTKYCKDCSDKFEKCKECDRSFCRQCFLNFGVCFICRESMCGKCHHKIISFKNESTNIENNKRRNAINDCKIENKRDYICY
jgi:hypothetical protein